MKENKSVWLTYAWEDNKNQDVDFVAQELIRIGVDVKLDRWNLTAGKRLWEQIESFIQDPQKSDGWIIYATQASFGSEACKEEFAFASLPFECSDIVFPNFLVKYGFMALNTLGSTGVVAE